MSLYERYELLDLNRDLGVKTFEAREIATGRPVKVHLFVHPSAPLQAALLKAIDKLPDDQRERIVEQGKHEGTPYLVTDRLADYPGLSEWVQAVGRSPKASKPLLETAGAWKVPAAPAATAPAAPAVAAPVAPTVSAPIATPVSAPPPQVNPAPGEFTRMFQSPVPAPSTPAPVPPAPAASVLQAEAPPVAPAPPAQTEPPTETVPRAKTEPPVTKEAGEFTRMFQAPAGYGTTPVPPAPASPTAPAAAKSGPGEFTRFFQTPSPAGPLPQSPAVQQPLAPQAPGRSGFNQVSEFTRTFGKGTDVPAPPLAAAPPQQEPGEFTRMFHSPVVGGAPSAAQPSSPAPQAGAQPLPPASGGAPRGFSIPAPAPAPPQPAGPGEYTRQFSAPAQLTFGQTSATPSPPVTPHSSPAFSPPAMAQPAMPNMAPAPAPARKSNLPLILGIVGIVVVMALIIVFFAMRPK